MNDGGPAFPLPETILPDGRIVQVNYPGMSLRDWFAGMALQGMVSGVCGHLQIDEVFSAYAHGPCDSEITERAYAIANVMIAAREKH